MAKSFMDQLGEEVELITLNFRPDATRCRIRDTEHLVYFNTRDDIWDLVPGEVLRVVPESKRNYRGKHYLVGSVTSRRIDVSALGLQPLALEDRGMWDPAEEYWRDEEEPLSDWERLIDKAGTRPCFEMEQVVPGDDFTTDGPILEAIELNRAGQSEKACSILNDLVEADLRCLDGHCHLGNMVFDEHPQTALKCYQIGVEIGDLSIPKDANPALPWGWIDNRPYLRCLHGYGLCLWRLERFKEAAAVFERLLWFNPADNQGIRFMIDEVLAGKAWQG